MIFRRRLTGRSASGASLFFFLTTDDVPGFLAAISPGVGTCTNGKGSAALTSPFTTGRGIVPGNGEKVSP